MLWDLWDAWREPDVPPLRTMEGRSSRWRLELRSRSRMWCELVVTGTLRPLLSMMYLLVLVRCEGGEGRREGEWEVRYACAGGVSESESEEV